MPKGRPKSVSKDEEFNDQLSGTGAGELGLRIFFSDSARYGTAASCFAEFLESHPENILARALLAECRVIGKFQLEAAVEDCRVILTSEPDRARIQFVLGRALVLLGRWSEAVAPLVKAARAFPDDVDTLPQPRPRIRHRGRRLQKRLTPS